MDITHLFKAGIMTVKLQRTGEQDPQRILPKPKSSTNSNVQKDEFSRQAKEVCHKITTLRNVLIENRAAYMRIGQHLKSAVQMTDEQRDLIDRESEKFFTFFTQYLGQMRSDWRKAKRKQQQKLHMEAVIELLVAYLKTVQQVHTDMKKYRVQHELETYRLLKLAADKKKIPVRPAGEQRSRKTSTISTSSRDNSNENEKKYEQSLDLDTGDGWDLDDDDITAPRDDLQNLNEESTNLRSTMPSTSAESKAQVALDEDIQKSQQLVEDEAEKNLSPEDIQMFEAENVQLYHELQGLSEEVEAIEKNVVDIATLQDIFTEKVTLQQHNIERIVNAVIGSTENVKDANEQIKEAIQRNAGLRVWSLFFLLVMSFALLFLDWYYD